MRVAKIKFSEAQVRMIITGKTVVVNLPDAQLHLTMDTTQIETRRAAEGFADVGKKSRFDDFDIPDFMGESKGNSFKDIFNDLFKGKG